MPLLQIIEMIISLATIAFAYAVPILALLCFLLSIFKFTRQAATFLLVPLLGSLTALFCSFVFEFLGGKIFYYFLSKSAGDSAMIWLGLIGLFFGLIVGIVIGLRLPNDSIQKRTI